MPFAQLFPEQIVNVQWGGGIFVVKSLESFLYRGKGTKESGWQSVGTPFDIIGAAAGNSGSSYAAEIGKTDTEPGKPVFVISSVRADDDGNNGSVILASRDGRNWEIVFELYEVNDGPRRDPYIFEPTGIVWDDNGRAFYAAFYTVVALFDEIEKVITFDGERIYRSSNGFTWLLHIDEAVNPEPPGIGFDSTSLLLQFCKKPENTKGANKMPDGLQAYSETSKTFMTPTALTTFSPVNGAIYDSATSSVKIVVENDDGSTTTATRPTSAPCFAVAHTGGSWAACGGADRDLSIDISTDSGETWTQAYTDHSGQSFPAATVSAGIPGKRDEA